MFSIVKYVLDFPKLSLALLLLATVVAGSRIPTMQYDSSIRSFIMDDDKDFDLYNRYKAAFGQDDMLVIAFETEDAMDPKSLELIRRLTGKIEQVDNVFDVRSLANAEFMKGTEDSFEAVRIIEGTENDPALRKARSEMARTDELSKQDLISDDGRKTALIVTLRASRDENDMHQKEIIAIEKIVKEESAATGIRFHMIGERYLDLRFLGYIQRDMIVFVPVTYAVILLLLYASFRNLRLTLIAFGAMAVCQIWVMALVPILGYKMNSVNAGLPSLILCLALTEAVHWMHGYRRMRHGGLGCRPALEKALRELVLPSFLTVLACGAGFGSLGLSHVTPIHQFGILAALASLICFVVMVMMLPPLILVWREKDDGRSLREKEAGMVPASWFVWLANVLLRHRRVSWTVIVVVTLVCFAGLLMVKVEVDRTRYLKRSSDIYQSMEFIEKNLCGASQLDIWIETGKPGMIKDPAVLRQIEDMAGFLREQPEIENGGKVLSICDFLKAMNKAFYEDKAEEYKLPDTRERVAQFLLLYSMSGRKNELDKYVDYPYSRTRISVRTAEHNSKNLDALVGRMRAHMAKNMDPALNAKIASLGVVTLNVFHYLLDGMTVSFMAGCLVIAVLMFVAYRSIKVGLISLAPNLIPTIACLGLLGWLDIPLEVATAMIFSIALGVTVDDTIHCISHFQLEFEESGDAEASLKQTLAKVGSSMVESTVVISAGFLVLVFASLRMNIWFGVISACVMVIAMLCDLTITPLCATGFSMFRRKSQDKAGETKEDTRANGTR